MLNATGAHPQFLDGPGGTGIPRWAALGSPILRSTASRSLLETTFATQSRQRQQWFDWYSKELPKFSVTAPVKWTAAHDRWAFGLGYHLWLAIPQWLCTQRTTARYLNSSGGQGGTGSSEGKIRFLKEVTKPGDPQIAILLVIAPDQDALPRRVSLLLPRGRWFRRGTGDDCARMIEVLSDRTGAGKHHVISGAINRCRNASTPRYCSGSSRRARSSCWTGLIWCCPASRCRRWRWRLASRRDGVSIRSLAHYAFISKRTSSSKWVSLYIGSLWLPACFRRRWVAHLGLWIWSQRRCSFTLLFRTGWKLGGKLKVKLNLPWPSPITRRHSNSIGARVRTRRLLTAVAVATAGAGVAFV